MNIDQLLNPGKFTIPESLRRLPGKANIDHKTQELKPHKKSLIFTDDRAESIVRSQRSREQKNKQRRERERQKRLDLFRDQFNAITAEGYVRCEESVVKDGIIAFADRMGQRGLCFAAGVSLSALWSMYRKDRRANEALANYCGYRCIDRSYYSAAGEKRRERVWFRKSE